jgi:hypothetical protein
MPKTPAILPAERIESQILLIRGHKVMLAPHLAALYGAEPRALVQAVKRNRERFPKDFMFQLSAKEFANLKSQFVISSWISGYLEFGFNYGELVADAAPVSSLALTRRTRNLGI